MGTQTPTSVKSVPVAVQPVQVVYPMQQPQQAQAQMVFYNPSTYKNEVIEVNPDLYNGNNFAPTSVPLNEQDSESKQAKRILKKTAAVGGLGVPAAIGVASTAAFGR